YTTLFRSLEPPDLIPELRRALEVLGVGGGLHRGTQVVQEVVLLSGKEGGRLPHLVGVLLPGGAPGHARRAALADIVVETRPREEIGSAHVAGAQLEQAPD